jgi:hypothetical protein
LGFGNGRKLGAQVLLAVACGCAHQPKAPPKPAWFAQKKFASAEVCMGPGENLWLSRLRCPDGERLKVVAHNEAGTRNEPATPDDPRLLQQLDAGRRLQFGEPDLHLIDAVTISCSNGDHTFFVDTYHCTQFPEMNAPDGMTIKPLPDPPDH